MKIPSVLTLTFATALCATSSVYAAAEENNTKLSSPFNKAAAKPKDACGLLGQQGSQRGSPITYEAVKGCYEIQKFRSDIAAKTLTSLENTLGNFYAFVDQAKQDPTKTTPNSVFKSPPVDLMKELGKIRKRKNWKSDYEFQQALTYLTLSVNDGHLAYTNYCYRTATFRQPISLYAPVVGGKQSVRVFYVDTEISKKGLPKDPSSLIDCVVETIDGKPALQAIQEFTDRTSAISRDPGVRLNDALASTSWYDGEWSSSPGGFATRWEVPAKSSMDYKLKCGSKTQRLTVPWAVRPSDAFEFGLFKDAKSYWEVQCQGGSSEHSTNGIYGSGRNSTSVRHPQNGIATVAPATTFFRGRGKLSPPVGGPRNGKPPKVITKAKLVYTSFTTAFYQFVGDSKLKDSCVAVHATEEASGFDDSFGDNDYTDLIKGFQRLQDLGCTKLIFDMTNNGGGSVDFAYFFNKLFFPNAKPYFAQDLRDNSLVQAAARKAIQSKKVTSLFDARGFSSAATGKPYKDASMFLKGVQQKRGGSSVTFTQKNFFAHKWSFLPLSKSKQLKFKPENMAIITNGFCGSACTMIATRFNIEHKVKTYAIGGIAKRPLSYFTFPGGFVLNGADITYDIRALRLTGVKNVPTYLPTMSTTYLTVGELYAHETSTIPLEYDAKYHPADVHLDQDPVSARHPDQVWVKVAKEFGSKK